MLRKDKMSTTLERPRDPNLFDEAFSPFEKNFVLKAPRDVFLNLLAALKTKEMLADIPHLLEAITAGALSEDANFMPHPWDHSFTEGAKSRLRGIPIEDFRHDSISAASNFLWDEHPNAPIDQESFLLVSTAKKENSRQSRDFYSNRIKDLIDGGVSTELLSLLLIEMSSFTTIGLSHKAIEQYLNPRIKQAFVPVAAGSNSGEFTYTKLEVTLINKVDVVLRAFGIRAAALSYLRQSSFDHVYRSGNLPDPLSAWMTLLHTNEPPKAINAEFRQDRTKCCYILLEGNSVQCQLAIITFHKKYPKLVPEYYAINSLRTL